MAAEDRSRAEAGLTLRAFVLAVLLTVVFGFWVRQAEIVILATQITESVPPIPALAALLVLMLLNPLLRLLGRRFALTRGEILTVYTFVAIAISMAGCGVIRFWLALLTAPFYFASPSNNFASLHASLPGWLAVKDPKAIHDLYEMNRAGQVPWHLWLPPLGAWTAFFAALWFCMLCLMLLVHRRWVHGERLAYPIVALPMEITASAGARQYPSFFRNPWMWAGFGLAALYNAVNILHALFPALPAPGKSFDLTPLMNAPPWDTLRPFTFWYRPDLIGFGFLVPSEVCFSIWFFYLLGKVEAMAMVQFAHDLPGAPFEQEQSIGAFLLLGAWYLWQVRGDIAAQLRRPPRGSDRSPVEEPPEASAPAAPRWALPGLVLSFAFVCWFSARAGMAPWAASAYLAIVLLVALVCARIRAEAGVPIIWLFPFYQQKKILLYTLGTAPFMTGGLSRTLVIFAVLTFLSRGYFPSLIGYQAEALKVAGEVRLSRARLCVTIIAAVFVGLLVAYYIHLAPYYRFGAQNLRGGIWGSDMAVQEYTDVIAARDVAEPPDWTRISATGGGAIVTAGLLLCRRAFVGFPLHPLGYAVSTAYGALVWWPFFTVWLLKAILLRLGGLPLYRRAIPAFLGFALGHFFVAGVIWGLLGALWPDAAEIYPVWFG